MNTPSLETLQSRLGPRPASLIASASSEVRLGEERSAELTLVDSATVSDASLVAAHQYRCCEFWASNWVYEGLTSYGANGAIEPALAVTWNDPVENSDGNYVWTFNLRENVKFQDGADWDCSVAKVRAEAWNCRRRTLKPVHTFARRS